MAKITLALTDPTESSQPSHSAQSAQPGKPGFSTGNVNRPVRDILLIKERVSIGRAPHNDVVIDHRAVSAEHAVIVTRHGDSYLEDLNSTNGTRINGQPVRRHYLQDGDVIEVAQVTLTYSEDATTDLAGVSGLQGPYLKVLDGPHAGKVTPLLKPMTSIGLYDGEVAVVTRRAGGFYITHLEGKRPTAVNGKEIGTGDHLLAPGDEITMAGTRIRYEIA
jgi:pSer/pThr/pTyr-binding forkhead associated (FHA) protein